MNLMQMSFTAGILIVVITVFRIFFLHHVPKKVMVLLWEIAILRLLVPFTISLPFPGIGDLGAVTLDSYRIEMIGGVVIDKTPEMGRGRAAQADGILNGDHMGTSMAIMEDTGVTEVSAMVIGLDKSYLLWMVYGLVAFAMALGSLYLYFRDSQFFREGLPMPEREKRIILLLLEEKDRKRMEKVKFCISDRTASPVTYGIFRPSIVFPKGLYQNSEKEITFWLKHELVHIRHRDNLKKVIAHSVLCLHWFNPLVWLMYLLFNRDMELLCDEAVVHKKQESRKDYALALLSMAQQKSRGFQTGLGFGKNAVTERITAVMKFKKVGPKGILGAAATVAMALTAFGSHYVPYVVGVSSTAEYLDDMKAAEYTITAEDLQANDEALTYGSVNVAWEEPPVTVDSTTMVEDAVYVKDLIEVTDAVQEQETVLTAASDTASVSVPGMAEVSQRAEVGDSVITSDFAEANEEGSLDSVVESSELPEEIGKSIERVMKEYQDFGMSIKLMEEDYQLYYEGEPVYFFADNTVPEEQGFSGRLFLREANEENGKTGVITQYDENGRISGVKRLTEKESEAYTRRWR